MVISPEEPGEGEISWSRGFAEGKGKKDGRRVSNGKT